MIFCRFNIGTQKSDTKNRVLSIQILTRSKREFGAGASASLGARVLDPSFTSVQGTSRHLFGLGGSGFGAGAFCMGVLACLPKQAERKQV